jgi:hypothetical protein
MAALHFQRFGRMRLSAKESVWKNLEPVLLIPVKNPTIKDYSSGVQNKKYADPQIIAKAKLIRRYTSCAS